MLRFRYSEWDGSQEIPELEADDLLDNVAEDLMNFGDLQHALRNLLQRGMCNPMGQRMQGLRDLLQQLRQQRRNTLDRFNLSSAFDDIQKRLEEILNMEKDTLQRRLDQASQELGPQEGQPQASGQQDGQDGEQGDDGSEQNTGDQAGGQRPGQQQGGQQMSGARSGQRSSGQNSENRQLAQMMRDIAQRKMNTLNNLPQDVGGQIKQLQDYEFIDPEAAHKFQELMEMLKKAMMETFFKDMYDQIAGLSPEQMERLKQMIKDLNKMLSERMAGGEPDFDQFMQQYGDLFGPNPPQSLDELIAQMQQQISQMQNLLNSLPGDMRQQLEDLLREKIGDAELQQALTELAINLDILSPLRENQNPYPFRGDEEIDLNQAMRLMDQLQGMDELEKQLEQSQYTSDLDQIDPEKLRDLLGDEAAQTFERLKEFLEILERAGYIRKKGDGWELTPRAIRKIGQRALGEIYAELKKAAYGRHQLKERGVGGERANDIKKYEFGDPFHLQLQQTLMNAVFRDGPEVPVRLDKEDFEVYSTEQLTQTATVLMVDLSWSMALRGSFQAAKKVALALNNLIRQMFPRDSLYIIGFSAYARELKAEQLPYVRWDESVLGTNMHHALMMAQQHLARHKAGTKQIIMITDGEPTAHLEHGRSYFSYPPSPITIRETLKEVRRCTRKDITINTFMLDRSYYLKEFVNQIAKINKGRVFYTTPDKLGQYILVDYISQKRKRVGAA